MCDTHVCVVIKFGVLVQGPRRLSKHRGVSSRFEPNSISVVIRFLFCCRSVSVQLTSAADSGRRRGHTGMGAAVAVSHYHNNSLSLRLADVSRGLAWWQGTRPLSGRKRKDAGSHSPFRLTFLFNNYD